MPRRKRSLDRLVIRATLFGDYELMTESNYLEETEDYRGVMTFPCGMFFSHADCESFARTMGLIPTGATIVWL